MIRNWNVRFVVSVFAKVLLTFSFLQLTAPLTLADERCEVTDPTGTPLNVRAKPNGRKLTSFPNGLLLSVIRTAPDNKGRPWALVRSLQSGAVEGWVFKEYITCYSVEKSRPSQAQTAEASVTENNTPEELKNLTLNNLSALDTGRIPTFSREQKAQIEAWIN